MAHATGQYVEAVRLAGEAFGALSSMGHPAGFGSYAALLCQIGRHIGFGESGAEGLFGRLRADPANARADDANDSLKSVFPALAVALMSLQRGQADEAARCYERAGPARSWDPAPSLRLSAWALGLDVAIALGAMSDVSYLAGRLAPYGSIHIASGAGGGGYLGPVVLHLGKAATALSHHDQAVAHLEAARTACAQAGAPGFAAPVAARLEMTPFSERIVRLRERLRAPGPAGQELSPREVEVAKLVGQGLTNRQIAAALFISERTAQNHVQHILVKLGMGNRSQIAAWATARPAGE